jgi:hypothetical protein
VRKVSGNSQNRLHDGVMALNKLMIRWVVIILVNDGAQQFLLVTDA